MNYSQLYERYQRQMILKEIGVEGQQRLLEAKVLLIGAGGLGCPLLQYLTAAGVGTLGIVDDDVVVLNNLHRQVLFSVTDIGFSKAEKAAQILQKLNPEINSIAYKERFTTRNAFRLIRNYDIVVDGTDNFATRYLINDACVLLNKPLVFGAIAQYEGQVSVFNFKKNESDVAANYRDLFPHPPKEGEVRNCAEAGVLGVLPGIIGSLMANETIKLITGIGEPLANQLFTYHALTNQFDIFTIPACSETRLLIPENEKEFRKTNYDWLCSPSYAELEIGPEEFNNLLGRGDLIIVDVREPEELPVITGFPSIKIPLAQLIGKADQLQSGTVITFCQSGKRSLQAARILSGIFGDKKKIFSLRGGILNWEKQKQPA